MKLTKSQLKQIIKEELLILETSPHVVTSRGHSQELEPHQTLPSNIVHDNDGKGWESPQEALNSFKAGEWKALQAKHPRAILYPEMAEDDKAYIFKHSFQ